MTQRRALFAVFRLEDDLQGISQLLSTEQVLEYIFKLPEYSEGLWICTQVPMTSLGYGLA